MPSGFALLLIPCLVAALVGFPAVDAADSILNKINYFVIIDEENWSFDGLLGFFPGAEGIPDALRNATPQLNVSSGKPFSVLTSPLPSDPRFPATLSNAPWDLNPSIKLSERTPLDLVHKFYTNQKQMGKNRTMDRFAYYSDSGSLSMSYYDLVGLNASLAKWAKEYTLTDHFFQSAYGGSFLSHQFMICACVPVYQNSTAPDSMVSQLGPDGFPASISDDRALTPGPPYRCINTMQSVNHPRDPTVTDLSKLVPPFVEPTIGDLLSAKGIDWKYYSQGWDDAISGHPDPLFQFHHQPFMFYKNYSDGTAAKTAHLKDMLDFYNDLDRGTLPPVSWLKPLGANNMHPQYAAMSAGLADLDYLMLRLTQSPLFQQMLIIITFDENGGRWDHVSPPIVDEYGYGPRIPTVLVSPYVKRGYVDKTIYDHASILKTLENRFGLPNLGERDLKAKDFTNALTSAPTDCVGKFAAGKCVNYKEQLTYHVVTPATQGGGSCPFADGYATVADCPTGGSIGRHPNEMMAFLSATALAFLLAVLF